MIDEKSWKEFRDSGLVLIINQILHIFGWAIIFELEGEEEEKVKRIYPARVRFRGFDNETVSKAYVKLSKYMKANSEELLKEAEE